jgi:hypothetical protein
MQTILCDITAVGTPQHVIDRSVTTIRRRLGVNTLPTWYGDPSTCVLLDLILHCHGSKYRIGDRYNNTRTSANVFVFAMTQTDVSYAVELAKLHQHTMSVTLVICAVGGVPSDDLRTQFTPENFTLIHLPTNSHTHQWWLVKLLFQPTLTSVFSQQVLPVLVGKGSDVVICGPTVESTMKCVRALTISICDEHPDSMVFGYDSGNGTEEYTSPLLEFLPASCVFDKGIVGLKGMLKNRLTIHTRDTRLPLWIVVNQDVQTHVPGTRATISVITDRVVTHTDVKHDTMVMYVPGTDMTLATGIPHASHMPSDVIVGFDNTLGTWISLTPPATIDKLVPKSRCIDHLRALHV